MDIAWTPALSVGVREIDIQHRVLFRKIGDLLRALDAGKGADEIERTFSFLEDYAASHFAVEQKAMVIYKYPEVEYHINQHTIFTRAIRDLRATFLADGFTDKLAQELKEKLCDWLINHVSMVDKALGKFLIPRVKHL